MSPYQSIMRDHRCSTIVNVCIARRQWEVDAPEALSWLHQFAFRCSESEVRADLQWLVDRRFARYVCTAPVPSIRVGPLS